MKSSWFKAAVLVTIVGCGSENEADSVGGTDAGWEWEGSSGTTGSWWEERQAEVQWSVSFDGIPTDLLRTPTESLVAGHVDGAATVWRVTGAEDATEIWSSSVLGRDAKLVRYDDGTVLVVALAPGGLAFAPLEGAGEPTFITLMAEPPALVDAVPGAGGDLWVALAAEPDHPGRILRVASDGDILASHTTRASQSVVGILRDGGRTLAFGNSDEGDGWERCIPDDGTPTSAVSVGWRATGAWTDGARTMLGFDAGGAGCATELDCEPDEDMDELIMPMPAQAAGAWSYGRDADRIVIASEDEYSLQTSTHDLVGEFVHIDGDRDGLAIIVTHDAGRAHIVALTGSAPQR